MPNWVRNQITFEGKGASKFVADLMSVDKEYGDIYFDFNKVIPMPKELNGEQSSIITAAMKYIVFKEPERLGVTNEEFEKIYNSDYGKKYLTNLWKEDIDYLTHLWEKEAYNKEETLEKAKQQLLNILKYDAPNWYYWCNRNWYTKWNSCETAFNEINKDKCEITFETAWNMPLPIIVKLSQMCKKITIKGSYSSEDIGSHCGVYYTDKKKLNLIQFEDCSNQAYETYIKMWGMPNGLKFNTDTFRYEWVD